MSSTAIRCPKCGEVCESCAVEKKERFSSSYSCKNCGAKINVTVVGIY
jgi:transcription elongation factor Elf1